MIYIYSGIKHANKFDVIRSAMPDAGFHPASSAKGCHEFPNEFKNIISQLGLKQRNGDGYTGHIFPDSEHNFKAEEAGWMSINKNLTERLINMLDAVEIEYQIVNWKG